MDQFINIKKYFNDKIIDNPKREISYVLGDNFYPSGQVVCKQGVPFYMDYTCEADNLICCGQEIEINAMAEKIFVLGFSELGVFKHPIKLITEEREINEYIELHDKSWFRKFDWVFDRKKEVELRKCRVYGKIKGSLKENYMYYSTTEIQKQYVKKMVLPECEWTHIFAVTVRIKG